MVTGSGVCAAARQRLRRCRGGSRLLITGVRLGNLPGFRDLISKPAHKNANS